MYCTVKNIGSKTLWRITAIHQVFLPILTISITFPMQMDFNLPKFFPPNFLQSLFAKLCAANVFYYTVIQISVFSTEINDARSNESLPQISTRSKNLDQASCFWNILHEPYLFQHNSQCNLEMCTTILLMPAAPQFQLWLFIT